MTHVDYLKAIVLWEEKLAIRRSAVLFITLWMTWRSFAWAAQYASQIGLTGGQEGALAAAAMIAAVTGPIVYLQKAVFSAYIDSKAPTGTVSASSTTSTVSIEETKGAGNGN